jgi:antitoxin component YwqK of YwqJK toxin-antitoxin module
VTGLEATDPTGDRSRSRDQRRARLLGTCALFLASMSLVACGRETRRTYFSDGSPWSETRFLDGQPDGLWIVWFKNGRKQSEGEYRLGLMRGLWKTWNEDGTLMLEATYERGKLEGAWLERWPNGQSKSRGTYESGQPEGLWTEWYENGVKSLEGHYVASGKDSQGNVLAGGKDGEWIGWRRDGSEIRRDTFERGKFIPKPRGSDSGAK